MIASGGARREATSSMAAALTFICASFVSCPLVEAGCSMVLPTFATSDRSRSASTGWGPGPPGGLPFGVAPGPGTLPLPLSTSGSTLVSLKVISDEWRAVPPGSMEEKRMSCPSAVASPLAAHRISTLLWLGSLTDSVSLTGPWHEASHEDSTSCTVDDQKKQRMVQVLCGQRRIALLLAIPKSNRI